MNKALRLLSSNSSGEVLGLDDVIPDSSHANPLRTTREILVEKHPLGKPASTNTLLQGSPMLVNPMVPLAYPALMPILGEDSAAPSNPRIALACIRKHLCTTRVNPDHLSAFVACRLIPLDKCPGVRPIGIGKSI